MRRIHFPLIALFVAISFLAVGCATVLTQEQISRLDRIAAKIAEAERMDAVNCAPRELARAKAILDHARHESKEGWEAAIPYVQSAEMAADELLAKTRPCWEAKQKKPAPTISASVSPSSVMAGNCATLSWSSTHTDTVRLDPDGDTLSTSGSRDMCPASTTTYTLTASGPGGSATASATLNVAAPAPPPEPVAKPMEKVFGGIYFDFDRYNIRAEGKSVLNQVADYMIKNRDAKLTVEGHCDERGTLEYNLGLGERRAASAKSYLQNLGVDGGRISTLSYGEERPADPGHNEAAWAKNRRAEFRVQ